MMANDCAKKLIDELSFDILAACSELRKARQERAYKGLFAMLSALLLIAPAAYVFFGWPIVWAALLFADFMIGSALAASLIIGGGIN